ncbi:hypothetical protein DL98DRAFT_637214 [Cadophora sp. DSE1049]|nr:hypothetical protein DL98DRAFT_637214 [Cadophora sp. DSE1049]
MTMVLSWEESNYFSSSPIRRSHSQPGFIAHQTAHPKFPSESKTGGGFKTIISPTNSGSSSAPSSPRALHADFTVSSYSSTPARSSSLDASWEDQDEEDQIVFPSYDDVGYYGQVKDLEPSARLWAGDSYTVSPTSNSTSTNVSGPESPDLIEHAEDDTAVRIQPSRNVDYLSHNWKEEDIWSSRKHIVRNRKAYSNSARLENASWRTWTKSKNKLKTVPPESLNWLKGCDATWLYGPLQTGSDRSLRMPPFSPGSSSHSSKCNSFLNKKSILKKRSMSEIMLQRSLLGQAAVAVQAQQIREAGRRCDRLTMGRATSDFVTFPTSSRRMRREHPSLLPSVLPSGLASPSTGEEKHIHFNEQVEQYIALEVKGDEDEEPDSYAIHDSDDSDSDDGAITMRRADPKWKLPLMSSRKATPRASFSAGSKAIEMLPSTTLKDREDTSEPPETAVKHSNSFWNSGKLSPSPSQETLRDASGDDDADMDWQPPSVFANRNDNMAVTPERLQNRHTSRLSSCLNGDPSGMRRTLSGMFMPYEEDEDDVVTEGLFGKVVDTVNTAKDIAYVIWNVGWRR